MVNNEQYDQSNPSANATISNNDISNALMGMNLAHARNSTIENNTVKDATWVAIGINPNDVAGTKLSGNTINQSNGKPLVDTNGTPQGLTAQNNRWNGKLIDGLPR